MRGGTKSRWVSRIAASDGTRRLAESVLPVRIEQPSMLMIDHPQTRHITRIGVETPILVPSFSSRGFPALGVLLENLRNDLYGVCLVSAFDLSTQRLTVDLSDLTDLVFLDSGVYET